MYLALARKYRPQNFSQVIGQDPILQTLKHAIKSERIHHAYLFCGARGVGKTSLARILAKSLNCEKGPTEEPCQKCASCEEITKANSLDVIEIDAASNTSVDNIRELREQVKYVPQSRYKIYIIDEVHMLSTSAFNALLKTLEEPPKHVIFILATTEPHEIPVTILSRCQRFDFRKLSTKLLEAHFTEILKQENMAFKDEAVLHVIATCALGSVRDGLSLLDQVLGFGSADLDEVKVRLLLGLGDRLSLRDCFCHLVTGELEKALQSLDTADTQGLDLKIFTEDLVRYFRDLILLKSTNKFSEDSGPSEREFLSSLKDATELSLVLAQSQILWQGLFELSRTEFQKTSLEMTFVKISQASQMIALTDLIDELKQRKEARGGVAKISVVSKQEVPPILQKTGGAPAWYDFVKWVKKEKGPLGGYLNDAVPIVCSDQKVEVAYPETSSSRQMVLERKQIVGDLLKSHFGKSVEFVISTLNDDEKKNLSLSEKENLATQKLREEVEGEVYDHPVLKELLEKHGARVQEIKVFKKIN